MLKGIVDRFRLGRIERKIKRLHTRQRKTRADLKDLEKQHRDGDLTEARFEEQAADLREKKKEFTRQIKDLRKRKDQLEEELGEA